MDVIQGSKALLEEPEKDGLGMTGLFMAEDGFGFLFFKDEVADSNDKRISSETNSYGDLYIENIGGICKYTPSIDLTDALLEGQLDGVEWTLRMYKEYELWDAAPYIVETGRLAFPCKDCQMPNWRS